MSIQEEINQLTDQLIYHAHKYYVEDAPELTDFEYDQLSRKLRALEAQYPQFARPDSPPQRVGGKPGFVPAGAARLPHGEPARCVLL